MASQRAERCLPGKAHAQRRRTSIRNQFSSKNAPKAPKSGLRGVVPVYTGSYTWGQHRDGNCTLAIPGVSNLP